MRKRGGDTGAGGGAGADEAQSGALHAGVQAVLLGTACFYAEDLRLMAGNVVTLLLSLQSLSLSQGRPLRGAGAGDEGRRRGLFAAAELIAWRDGAEVLAASASAVLAKVGEGKRLMRPSEALPTDLTVLLPPIWC